MAPTFCKRSRIDLVWDDITLFISEKSATLSTESLRLKAEKLPLAFLCNPMCGAILFQPFAEAFLRLSRPLDLENTDTPLLVARKAGERERERGNKVEG